MVNGSDKRTDYLKVKADAVSHEQSGKKKIPANCERGSWNYMVTSTV